MSKIFSDQANAEKPILALTALIGRCHDLFADTASVCSQNDVARGMREKVESWLARLDGMAAKLHDPAFRVGVIGEFSCGKSTFINAFVGQNLLAGDILQGTTCAPTVLAWSAEPFITVKKADGEIIAHSTADNLTSLLAELSAMEEKTADIREIAWHAPLPALAGGLCLMDTPGLGALRQRHSAAAREAARGCDLLLVLSSLASTPLSRNLLEETEQLAGPDAKNRIFIGTFADKFSKAQLARLDSYFRQKLAAAFGETPPYFFVSAFAAIEEASHAPKMPGAWSHSFEKFKSDLLALITQNRTDLRARKIARLLRQLLAECKNVLYEMLADEIFHNLEDRQATIIREHEKAGKEICRDFTASCLTIKNKCEGRVYAEIENFRSALQTCVNSFTDVDKLKKYLNKGIHSDFAKLAGSFGDILRDELLYPMRACAREHIKQFAVMAGSAGREAENTGRKQSRASLALINFRAEGMDEIKARHENEEDLKIGGGLGAGIALALLVPGAGWLAGGLLALGGMFMGAFFMPDLKDLKKNSLKKLDSAFSKLRNDASLALSANYAQIHRALLAEVDLARRDAETAAKALENERANRLKTTRQFLENRLALLGQFQKELDKS